VVFIEDLKYNIAGATTLDRNFGISSFFHRGRVYLLDSTTVGDLPRPWRIVADNDYDPESGLPFVDIKLPELSLPPHRLMSGSSAGEPKITKNSESLRPISQNTRVTAERESPEPTMKRNKKLRDTTRRAANP